MQSLKDKKTTTVTSKETKIMLSCLDSKDTNIENETYQTNR